MLSRYTGNDTRADLIADLLRKYVTDIDECIGLGFCVSIGHANYMAEIFTRIGIPSVSLNLPKAGQKTAGGITGQSVYEKSALYNFFKERFCAGEP
ncbi:MAG: hypothetical protein Q7T80_01965 [Methanoregula sp.]|nr:hypothetical protein [Methanoregula sp.]